MKTKSNQGRASGDLVQLASCKFTYENGADRNRVFLWENISVPPFIRPVAGWKIVGYGQAPWPGISEGFAVMMEKITPEEDHGGMKGEDFAEGTRIWQHLSRGIFDELNAELCGARSASERTPGYASGGENE
jgi:hypothetical protein